MRNVKTLNAALRALSQERNDVENACGSFRVRGTSAKENRPISLPSVWIARATHRDRLLPYISYYLNAVSVQFLWHCLHFSFGRVQTIDCGRSTEDEGGFNRNVLISSSSNKLIAKRRTPPANDLQRNRGERYLQVVRFTKGTDWYNVVTTDLKGRRKRKEREKKNVRFSAASLYWKNVLLRRYPTFVWHSVISAKHWSREYDSRNNESK